MDTARRAFILAYQTFPHLMLSPASHFENYSPRQWLMVLVTGKTSEKNLPFLKIIMIGESHVVLMKRDT